MILISIVMSHILGSQCTTHLSVPHSEMQYTPIHPEALGTIFSISYNIVVKHIFVSKDVLPNDFEPAGGFCFPLWSANSKKRVHY